MSEQFKGLRHFTTRVDNEVQQWTQLQWAIAQVSSLLDSLPEKRREVEALAAEADAMAKKIEQAKEAHAVLMEQCLTQRRETQAQLQKEQQERVSLRETFRIEQQQHQVEKARSREELNDIQRQITQKKGELERLEQDLQATVKAVLRR